MVIIILFKSNVQYLLLVVTFCNSNNYFILNSSLCSFFFHCLFSPKLEANNKSKFDFRAEIENISYIKTKLLNLPTALYQFKSKRKLEIYFGSKYCESVCSDFLQLSCTDLINLNTITTKLGTLRHNLNLIKISSISR